MVVVLFAGGIQMKMLGVLREYLWRSRDETRARPRYVIEKRTKDVPASHTMHVAGQW